MQATKKRKEDDTGEGGWVWGGGAVKNDKKKEQKRIPDLVKKGACSPPARGEAVGARKGEKEKAVGGKGKRSEAGEIDWRWAL